MRRVAIYFYSEQWVPIIYSSLTEAIALHRQLLQSGKEIFVFLPHLDPRNCPKLESSNSRIRVADLRAHSQVLKRRKRIRVRDAGEHEQPIAPKPQHPKQTLTSQVFV